MRIPMRRMWFVAAACAASLAIASAVRSAMQEVPQERIGVARSAVANRNPLPTVEERLLRIERLSAELSREAQALRHELKLPGPQTQPAVPAPEFQGVPSLHVR